MTNEFISALERIVETEKNRTIQEKTMYSIQNQINTIENTARQISIQTGSIKKPVLRQVSYIVEPVNEIDNRISDKINAHITKIHSYILFSVVLLCGIIGWICGKTGLLYNLLHNAESTEPPLQQQAMGGCIGGLTGGFLIALIVMSIYDLLSKNEKKIEAAQEAAQEAAKERANVKYAQEQEKARKQYQSNMEKYIAQTAEGRRRVACEEQKIKVLENVLAGLKEKHAETEACLKQFYEKAGIYDTYQNLIAVTYFIEYLKSGICTELGGRDGAYMTFKYEMYEQFKIERLDTIISKLGQLHFDNSVLNATMEAVGDKVSHLAGIAADVRAIELDNSDRIDQLGSQLSSDAQRLLESNRVIAYNQECTKQELENVEWFERMNYYFKQ